MSELYFLALSFGLLGFVEPCSVGANGIFLSRLREKERAARLVETAKSAVSRSLVLGLFGLLIAFFGGFVFTAQKGFWLGLLYLALGLAVILDARFGLFGRFSFGRPSPEKAARSLGLGLLFGL